MTFLDKTGLSYLWSKLNEKLNLALAGKADVTSLPTKTSELQNDSGYLIGKPTYTASEIGAGTFKGQVVANASAQTPATSLLRNSKLVATETNPSNNGEICWLCE